MYFLNSLLKALLISVVITVINGQKFCDIYEKKNSNVLINSIDSKNLFVFIGNYFWILNELNKNLEFSSNNSQAFGRNDGFGQRMTTIFSLKTDEQNYFVFYDVRH